MGVRIEYSDGVLEILDDVLPSGDGLLVMHKVYLDRGAKESTSDGVMTVACVIFAAVPYKRFVRGWNRMLRGWGASAFHATDFYNGADEFVRDTPARRQRFEDDSRTLPTLIGPYVKHVLAVAFRPEEFLEKATARWSDRFGTSVHAMAAQIVLWSNGDWAEQNGHEGFAYFMESGDPDETQVVRAVSAMKANPATQRSVRVKSFTVVDKGVARGLEAADFVAWHWNKYYIDKRSQGDYTPRKDFAALVNIAPEACDEIFVTGGALDYFFEVGEQFLITS